MTFLHYGLENANFRAGTKSHGQARCLFLEELTTEIDQVAASNTLDRVGSVFCVEVANNINYQLATGPPCARGDRGRINDMPGAFQRSIQHAFIWLKAVRS